MYTVFTKSRLKTIKQDIKSIPFEEISSDEDLKEFGSEYRINDAWSWLGPQLLAHLATYTLPTKNEEGLYSPIEYLKKNIDSPYEKGLWHFVIGSRSLFMKGQCSPEHLPYCALVPLYMAAQKKFNNINYSSWGLSGLEHLVGSSLYKAMTSDPSYIENIDNLKEELVSIRIKGLGDNNPKTFHKLIGVNHTLIGKYDGFTRAMLTQIWCAHPANRHKYMILDPWNWDNMPEPLITVDVTRKMPWETDFTKLLKSKKISELPWETELVS